MSKSYLERAKSWICTADDIDIEQIESTVTCFSEELKKSNAYPIQNASKIKDLDETLDYLRSELKSLAGVDELPIPSLGSGADSEIVKCEFDSSPLVDVTSEPIHFSKAEKADALAEIRSSTQFISASDLLSRRKTA